ncbi:NADP-dependent oxidoreductase [Salipiger sp. P9]|uniref:NADP-dependent oxidoreductase n=1 Tax=Salipiger pentaromativorans TaxID=2943193 RepID=UPI0021581C16|nr:NADP-dependent oxidoreductase [Salipiger pentaromativorans]MCR8547567.1 NADP-dependent oxidoreductase [Salipiger pentaromativorans]
MTRLSAPAEIGGPNRRTVLAKPVEGIAQAEHFALDTATVAAPAAGEILVENHYLSVEPAMRGWLADKSNYSAPIGIGEVMRAIAVGKVLASGDPAYAEGDIVTGWFGWQEAATVGVDKVIRKVTETDLPVSLSLGLLGLNGLAAYLGLTIAGEPKPGDTVVVSTAAGSVGSAVGQIAKILGCRTVGITRGGAKMALCRETFGYDAVLDYAAEDLEAGLAAACPDGINVYFDNTAGPISDAVRQQIAVGARIVVCGTASISSWDPVPQGPRVERDLLTKRARMQGFLAFDHADKSAEAFATLAGWIREGRLAWREDVLEGIESCPDAIAGLYRGENMGKRLIRLR